MDKFLEKVMNFINENTMLLILICIFLIVVLIIYLIDNTIKSKRLEEAEAEKKNEEPKILESNIPDSPKEETKVEAPVVEEPKVVTEQTIETPVVSPVEEADVQESVSTEVPTVNNIDELLNKDYSSNNNIVNNIDNQPIVEEPKVEPVKSKYKNDKKLSDIIGKKSISTVKSIETTQDFSDELDRILQKLNEEPNTNSIEDTTDYTNMF